jgi:hypothetical protein
MEQAQGIGTKPIAGGVNAWVSWDAAVTWVAKVIAAESNSLLTEGKARKIISSSYCIVATTVGINTTVQYTASAIIMYERPE